MSRRKEAESRLAAAHAELSALANTDGLTGLANRRRFDEAIRAECDPGRAEGPVSLLLMDIDRFKLFNDRYGHPAGDECLRRVAGAVRDALDGVGSLAARYGGEEFAVLLPNMGADEAERTAEKVRVAVQALTLAHDGNPANGGVVTVSVGQATTALAERTDDGQAAATRLVAEADRLLYEAKRLGRNRVASAASTALDGVLVAQREEAARIVATAQFARAGESLPPETLDGVAASAARLLEAPVGCVTLVGETETRLIGRHGTDLAALPREVSFCSHAILGEEPLVVGDLLDDERFAGNPLLRGETALRFYAGAPLFHPDTGKAVGAVCVMDVVPRENFDEAQRQMLKELSNLMATRLAAAS